MSLNKCAYILTVTCILLCTGCFTGTTSTITEYGADGKVVKVTQVGESVIKSVTESTKDKTCITWESGWDAHLLATAATTSNPTPTLKIGVGKVDKGSITLHKDHQELQKSIADIIKSTRQDLSVTTEGVTTTVEPKEK